MKNPTHRGTIPATELGRVLRFLLVGVLNTAVGLGSIYACKYFFALPDVPANVIGYLFGLVNSFFWNRRWTFAHSGDTTRTVIKFILTFLVAYATNLATVLALVHGGVNPYLAHALATAPYTALFYLGSRYFVFTQSSVRSEPREEAPAPIARP